MIMGDLELCQPDAEGEPRPAPTETRHCGGLRGLPVGYTRLTSTDPSFASRISKPCCFSMARIRSASAKFFCFFARQAHRAQDRAHSVACIAISRGC